MTTTATPTDALHRLYLIRFGFALIWAIALFATATRIGPVSGTLLVLYPLVDAAAVALDASASRRFAPGLRLNLAISTVAAAGLIIAVTSGIPAVLRVWGVWAIVAGLLQLAVAVRRRALAGQGAMIASGAISTVAGIAFLGQAGGTDPSLKNLAGYALLGGIFFLVSAVRLGRTVTP